MIKVKGITMANAIATVDIWTPLADAMDLIASVANSTTTFD